MNEVDREKLEMRISRRQLLASVGIANGLIATRIARTAAEEQLIRRKGGNGTAITVQS